jgi:hypothetical protein
MDWIQIISLILNAIFASGFMVSVLTIRSERRKRKFEADSVGIKVKAQELDIDIKEEEFNDIRLENMRKKMLEQDMIIADQYSTITSIMKTQSELKIELIRASEERDIAKYNECNVLNCFNRTPPRTER